MPDNENRVRINAPPKTKADEILEASYYQDLAGQAERLDKFALELIKLQLAIPALYTAILKFFDNKTSANTTDTFALFWIFSFWFVALVLSFMALFPMRRYEVKASPVIEPLPAKPSGIIAINAYVHFAAKRKRFYLLTASLCTFVGIGIAVFCNF